MDDPPCSSSSSSSLPRPRDVFLSFRGEDTRNNFVTDLYGALQRVAVKVYRDDEELKKGDDLSQLFKAIEESKISVVVFSEYYATSKWCLNELVKIMDCKVNQKQTVIPIFYRVDPSHVRKQTGSFGQAFDEHELSLGKDKDLVQSWRKALTEASKIAGWHSTENDDDAMLIDEIVESVFNKLLRMLSTSKESDLVGMESCIQKMELGTPLQMDKVRRIGISGMGGIGKTTIATAVYDQYRSSFDKVCFVPDVKEKFPRGGESLLEEILYRLLGLPMAPWREVCDLYRRMEKCNIKVLIVLDDVDTRDQIKTLLYGPSFSGGSRIIVTTRRSDILSGFEEHKAELLSQSDALTLFCQCAFKTNRPSREFDHVSRRAVKYAEGLPLALKVIGSLLGDMTSAFEWEQELNKMNDIRNPDIHKALIISYRGLDYLAQKIFLDIACFFRGTALDYVTKVLDIHGFHPIPVLVDLLDEPSSSSSPPPSSLPIDVFLNFRGEDTRNNFVCHLHSALNRALVKVYLDDEELKKGDDLSKLFKAIEESKISVVVFSEDYATSKWCLNELVKIMDCKVNQKQTVIPIFYRVLPSDVRNQTGSFGQAFDKHELSLGKDNDLVQSWRKALTEASKIVGRHFTKNE